MDLMSNGIMDLMSEGLAGVDGFYCIRISLYFMCFKSFNFNETPRIALLLHINIKDKYDLKKKHRIAAVRSVMRMVMILIFWV